MSIDKVLHEGMAQLARSGARYERVTNRLLKAWADDDGKGDWQATLRRIIEDRPEDRDDPTWWRSK